MCSRNIMMTSLFKLCWRARLPMNFVHVVEGYDGVAAGLDDVGGQDFRGPLANVAEGYDGDSAG